MCEQNKIPQEAELNEENLENVAGGAVDQKRFRCKFCGKFTVARDGADAEVCTICAAKEAKLF